jgi:hypothetical protein
MENNLHDEIWNAQWYSRVFSMAWSTLWWSFKWPYFGCLMFMHGTHHVNWGLPNVYAWYSSCELRRWQYSSCHYNETWSVYAW